MPIKDFGFEGVNNGDVWQFLLGRNCLGAKPRSQASWSLTQAFSEIPQHPKVRLMDDELVAQLTGVATILSGKYAFQVGVVAPRASARKRMSSCGFMSDARAARIAVRLERLTYCGGT